MRETSASISWCSGNLRHLVFLLVAVWCCFLHLLGFRVLLMLLLIADCWLLVAGCYFFYYLKIQSENAGVMVFSLHYQLPILKHWTVPTPPFLALCSFFTWLDKLELPNAPASKASGSMWEAWVQPLLAMKKRWVKKHQKHGQKKTPLNGQKMGKK